MVLCANKSSKSSAPRTELICIDGLYRIICPICTTDSKTLFENIDMNRFLLAIVCLLIFVIEQPLAVHGMEMSNSLYEAIEAARLGKATEAQRVMLLVANDDINYMRMNGLLSHDQYQKSQGAFDKTSQGIAKKGSLLNNADFTVQKRGSSSFTEGTDSDYIMKMKLKSKDPVHDIRQMQEYYNKSVNALVQKHKAALQKAGLSTKPRYNWHNKLDIDFMVDPKTVSRKQFQEVAKIQNDAYKRPLAAEYEAITRGAPGILSQAHYRAYYDEMNDFIKKKQEYIADAMKDPRFKYDQKFQTTLHRMMAQEQKYATRQEALINEIIKRHRLNHAQYGGKTGKPFYEVYIDTKGNAVMRKKYPGSLAAHGAGRSFHNRPATIAAHGVVENSITNNQVKLAEVMSMAARGTRGPREQVMLRDIANVTKNMNTASKGRVIEIVGQRRGKVFAKKLATEMRKLVPPRNQLSFTQKMVNKIDSLPKLIPGYNDNVANMSAARARLNASAKTAVGIYGKLMAVKTYYDMAKMGSRYWDLISRATDPNISEEESRRLADEAMDVSWQMAQMGVSGKLMQTMFTKTPTLAALHTSWTIGYDGTGYLLNNTETGKAFKTATIRKTLAAMDKAHETSELLTEALGGKSERMIDKERRDAVLSKFEDALNRGDIKLKSYATKHDVIALIKKGQYRKARQHYKPTRGSSYSRSSKSSKSSKGSSKTRTWTLMGSPEIYQNPVGVAWKRGMDYRFDFDPHVSSNALGFENIVTNVNRHTGSDIKRMVQFNGMAKIGSVPQIIEADKSYKVKVNATGKQTGEGGYMIEGWVEGDGLTIESDHPEKGYFLARGTGKTTDARTYTIKTSGGGKEKKLAFLVRGVGKVTWTYKAVKGKGKTKTLQYVPPIEPPKPHKEEPVAHEPEKDCTDDILKNIRRELPPEKCRVVKKKPTFKKRSTRKRTAKSDTSVEEILAKVRKAAKAQQKRKAETKASSSDMSPEAILERVRKAVKSNKTALEGQVAKQDTNTVKSNEVLEKLRTAEARDRDRFRRLQAIAAQQKAERKRIARERRNAFFRNMVEVMAAGADSSSSFDPPPTYTDSTDYSMPSYGSSSYSSPSYSSPSYSSPSYTSPFQRSFSRSFGNSFGRQCEGHKH